MPVPVIVGTVSGGSTLASLGGDIAGVGSLLDGLGDVRVGSLDDLDNDLLGVLES